MAHALNEVLQALFECFVFYDGTLRYRDRAAKRQVNHSIGANQRGFVGESRREAGHTTAVGGDEERAKGEYRRDSECG